MGCEICSHAGWTADLSVFEEQFERIEVACKPSVHLDKTLRGEH